jgi:hypothetical protein
VDRQLADAREDCKGGDAAACQPLVPNAVFPVPRRVLRKGFAEAGQEWIWRNWGVRWLIRRVELAMEQRLEGRSGLKPVAVFRFLSED